MKKKNYTDAELIEDIYRFIHENDRIPKLDEMRITNGYISICHYKKRYGTWNKALKAAGLENTNLFKYTKEFLISELHRFVYEHDRLPNKREFTPKNGYPSYRCYIMNFEGWNNALRIAGLGVVTQRTQLDGTEICSLCGECNSSSWYIVNNNRLCMKCIHGRKYYRGTLDPNTSIGFGTIIEHVVYNTLNDCIQCNTPEHFNAPYDLISEKYGNINVKASNLLYAKYNDNWQFGIKKVSKIPDYFILVGISKNKLYIEHVWIVPGINTLCNCSGICITNSHRGLLRVKQYEVTAEPYNKVYQNLDIYSLPEFCNFNKLDEVSA